MWRFRGCPWNEHIKLCLPFGKLTWQWNMDVLKMYSLLKCFFYHCHVSLQEGTSSDIGRMNKGTLFLSNLEAEYHLHESGD